MPGSSRFRVVAAALAAALLLSSCAVPGSDDATAEAQLPRDMSAAPAPLSDRDTAVPELSTLPGESDETEDAGAGSDNGSAGGGGSSGTADQPSTPAAPAAPPTTLSATPDPRGDARGGPGYADLRALTLSDTGRTAIVTVDLDAPVPKRLAEGEVMGLGVDLYTDAGGESDYQLFADGGSDGWFAYLQTPNGFVDYPGAFRIGKRRIVFEVPWSALGRPRTGSISSFVDWSRKRTPLNEFSTDLGPDEGTRSFRR